MFYRETVHMCNPTKYDMMVETENNKVSGIFSTFVKTYMNLLLQIANTTLTILEGYPGVGEEIGNTGVYTGCLGKLQRGEADLMCNLVDYPMDIANVSQGFVVIDESVSFTGFFPRPGAVKKADFSRSLFAFQWSVYLLILVYLVVFSIIFKLRSHLRKWISISCVSTDESLNHGIQGFRFQRKIRKRIQQRYKHSPGFIDVVRTFIGTNFIESDSLVVTVLVLTISVFSFLTITAYFNSLLNTDLVVPEQAVIYDNYDEIIKAGVKPTFLEGMTYHLDLKKAQEGSKGKQFWDWAVKKFGGEKKLLVPIVKESIGPHLAEMAGGRGLVFVGDQLSLTMRSSICGLFDRDFTKVATIARTILGGELDWNKYQDLQSYTRTDPSAPKKIKNIILGQSISKSPKFHSLLRTLFLRSYQHGHFQAILQFVSQAEMVTSVPGLKALVGPVIPKRTEIKDRCKTANKADPDIPPIDQVSLGNFKFSFPFYSALLALSMVIFMAEKVGNRTRQQQN